MRDRLSKQDTQMMKGAAICLLLFVHLFVNDEAIGGMPVQFFFSEDTVHNLALYARICVPMFVFVTAYGISAKIESMHGEISFNKLSRMFGRRYFNLMIPFWFIFILFQIVCNIVGKRRFTTIYGHGKKALAKFVIDGLGIADWLDTPTLNPTWWYMALALLLIIIVPFIAMASERIHWLPFIAAFICFRVLGLNGSGNYNFVLIAFLGSAIYFSDFFGKISDWTGDSKKRETIILIACIVMLIVAYWIKLQKIYTDIEYIVAVFSVIVLQKRYVGRTKYLSKALLFMGKHSMNIFLTHAFFRAYFCHDFIYSFKYSPAIWLAMLIISVAASHAIEWLKGVCGVNILQEKITARYN